MHYIVFFQGDSDGDDDDMDDDTLSDWNLRKWFGIDNTYSVLLCLFFSLVNNTLIKIFSIFFFREMLCSCLGCSCQCVPWWSFTSSSSNLEGNTLPSRLGSQRVWNPCFGSHCRRLLDVINNMLQLNALWAVRPLHEIFYSSTLFTCSFSRSKFPVSLFVSWSCYMKIRW